jgi:hypothetical protein
MRSDGPRNVITARGGISCRTGCDRKRARPAIRTWGAATFFRVHRIDFGRRDEPVRAVKWRAGRSRLSLTTRRSQQSCQRASREQSNLASHLYTNLVCLILPKQARSSPRVCTCCSSNSVPTARVGERNTEFTEHRQRDRKESFSTGEKPRRATRCRPAGAAMVPVLRLQQRQLERCGMVDGACGQVRRGASSYPTPRAWACEWRGF